MTSFWSCDIQTLFWKSHFHHILMYNQGEYMLYRTRESFIKSEVTAPLSTPKSH